MVIMLSIATLGYSQMMDANEAIIEKEKQMYESLKTGDMDTFKGNLADTFYSVTEEGIIDKAKEIKNMMKLKMESYELSDFNVMQAADGIVLVHYKSSSSGTYMDEQFDNSYYNTSAWAKMGEQWKAIMHASVKAAPMKETMGMEGQK